PLLSPAMSGFAMRCGVACAFALALAAHDARATERTETVALAYDAPNDCASETQFVARVAESGGHIETHGASPDARRLTVTIRADGGAFRGRLVVRPAKGDAKGRHVTETTCTAMRQ